MGAFQFSIPTKIVKKIVDKIPIENFVETGTYKGGTAFWAAKNFKKVYTIEIDEQISKETQNNPACPENVEFYIGNSKTELPAIVEKLSGRTFFWLDGHWCQGDVLEDECPLLFEIESMKKCHDAIIFIDDARCFMGPIPKWPEKMPRIDDIFATLRKTFPNHITTIQDDIIMCAPVDVITILDDIWQNSFWEKFTPVWIGRMKCIKWFFNLKKANSDFLVLNREKNG